MNKALLKRSIYSKVGYRLFDIGRGRVEFKIILRNFDTLSHCYSLITALKGVKSMSTCCSLKKTRRVFASFQLSGFV